MDQETSLPQHVSVVIVGAGPTGLAAANLLGANGIDVLVVERNPGISAEAKAISIDDEGLRICQAMGLIDAVSSHALLNLEALYLSGKRPLARVSPQSQRNGFPLISTFHQPEFEAILLQGVHRFPHVTVRFGHTLTALMDDDQGVRLTVCSPTGETTELTCAYLLACDGGRSFVRHQLGIPLSPPSLLQRPILSTTRGGMQRRVERHGQRWLVIDCVDDRDPASAAIFFCNPERPAVTVPAPGQRRRWEFMLLPGERNEALLRPETIRTLILQGRAALGASTVGEMPHVVRSAVYTFHAALATAFSRGHVFLLGDAAHLMPPFGGQGMNSGLRDAHNLCWKLVLVLRERARPSLLDTYQQERSPHAAQMVLFSSLLGSLVMPTTRAIAALRDAFIGTLMILPPTRDALVQARVKPQPRYRRGLLLSDGTRLSKALAGQMLPQPLVSTPQGEHILLDEALGDGFALIRLHEKPSTAFHTLQNEFWERLGTRFICVRPIAQMGAKEKHGALFLSQESPRSPLVVVDAKGELGAFLHHSDDLFVLVRPDRYILGAFHVREADTCIETLKRLV